VTGRSRRPVTTRIVAGFLAAIWLGAGAILLAVSVGQGRWLLGLCSIAALWYGLLWLRVVREGRQLRGRGSLLPWRRS
jgi:hypothetical protein